MSVPAASVDTGIGERSKHAREGYLLADQHPQLTFTLDQLLAARQGSSAVVAFRARGTVGLIGRTHAVDVTGTISKPDEAALARLGLSGDVMLVTAQFSLVIRETALAPGLDRRRPPGDGGDGARDQAPADAEEDLSGLGCADAARSLAELRRGENVGPRPFEHTPWSRMPTHPRL